MSNSHTKHKVIHKRKKTKLHSKIIREGFYVLFGVGFILASLFILWTASLKLPDFNDFENRKIANSTKIYDRTGKVLLYNVHDNIKRTQVKKEEINDYIKKATISIEDRDFYNHYGISIRGILRSVWVAITNGKVTQGGSTITQQVVKNALLTREKTLIRKLKEWVLAVKLDAQVSKDDILNIYLNESPYGGTIYGVEEASLSYFGKHAKDININEAAYLAAIPQAPSRYSPFNDDKSALENRKNTVLSRMLEQGYITQEEYDKNVNEKMTFLTKDISSGKAFHFVFYVKSYLEEKYGKDEVENGGLKVITTLDWDLQKEAERIVYEGAMKNDLKFGAKNSAMVAIDPRSGQILSMIGSRDYFDENIDGKFNVATALRQPGSTFKPFVYLEAFMQGFTPETILFDLPTNFSTHCDSYGVSLDGGKCYTPQNYDNTFKGPVSLRHALLWSLNIPAVKLQYIIGVGDTIQFVKKFGIDLGPASKYGLSLVLGGGEVSLLKLTNAYGVFANNGNYNPEVSILEIKDKSDNVLEKYTKRETEAAPKEYVDILNSVLIDSNSRVPAYSVNNPINYYDREVAVKTGTTNDFKDVWVIGYTPSIVVGMWGGNNNNAPVTRVAGTVLSPVWRKVMDYAVKNTPLEIFDRPTQESSSSTPGFMSGDICYGGTVQSIIGYINGYNDPQFNLWNSPIQRWASENNPCQSAAQPQTDPLTLDNSQIIIPPTENIVNTSASTTSN